MCDLLLTVFHSEAKREKKKGKKMEILNIISTILIMNPEPTFFTRRVHSTLSKFFFSTFFENTSINNID